MAAKRGTFVLTIGDEGGILTYLQGKSVVRRIFAATPNYADTRPFVDLMNHDPKAPLYVLVDLMDQSYIQQSLPPVSSLSINNLIKRKMERDFSAEDLKGALPIGREKTGRKDWRYLFVVLNNTPQLQAWMDVVVEQPNRMVGIFLLPVELELFIKRLDAALQGEKKKLLAKKTAEEDNRWQLLVAHNKVGGFRQVVLKGGKLIFARLAQPIGENIPEVIAGNIEQEISVTIEYLKRLGFTQDQKMEVVVIASEEIKGAISPKNVHVQSVRVLTPFQAGELLNLPGVSEPQDKYADTLLAAAFASSSKHLLKLQTPLMEKLNLYAQSLMAVRYGGVLAAVVAVSYGIYSLIALPEYSGKISSYENRIKTAEVELVKVQEEERKFPDDLDKMSDLVAIHQALQDLGHNPLEAINHYAKVESEQQALLTSYEWTQAVDLKEVKTTPEGQLQFTAPVMVKLSVDLFGTEMGSEKFDAVVTRFLEQVQLVYDQYTLTLTSDRPLDTSKSKGFKLADSDNDPIRAKPFYELKMELAEKTQDNAADAQTGRRPSRPGR